MRTRSPDVDADQARARGGAVLVTGGNSGIGYVCARELARAGRRVVIASRDRAASHAAVERICQDTGNHEVFPRTLDLGSLAEVRAFVAGIEADDLRIDTLVCNAGIQVNQGPTHSPDGHELTFAVNHLGHFLLVNLLLRRLVEDAPARIVVVASGVHDPKLPTGLPDPAVADMDTLAATGQAGLEGWNGRRAYVNSKLCNLWFTYELARRVEAAGLAASESPLSINAWEPGLVPGSGLVREYPAPVRLLWNTLLVGVAHAVTRIHPIMNPASKSGRALAEFALDPALRESSGRYYPSHTRWQAGASSDLSYDEERARELWEASARYTGLSSEDSPLA